MRMEKLEQALDYMHEIQKKLDVLANKEKEKQTFPVFQLQSKQLDLSIAAVDGGFLSMRFHGVDLVVARAAAVNFLYKNSKLASVFYFPSKMPATTFEVKMGLEENEANCFKQLFRLEQEIVLAMQTIQEFKPRMLLVDGSLLPLPSDRPGKESSLFIMYEKLLGQYAQLYKTAQKQGTLLVGVVKDTRSKRFVKNLEGGLSDGLFFTRYLKPGERVGSHSYQEQEDTLAKHIRVFYMKISEDDIPLRIEFLNNEKANEQTIADILYSLSSHSKSHSYPAPLIEADLRAMLDRTELERLEKAFHLNMPSLHALRRNNRPFR